MDSDHDKNPQIRPDSVGQQQWWFLDVLPPHGRPGRERPGPVSPHRAHEGPSVNLPWIRSFIIQTETGHHAQWSKPTAFPGSTSSTARRRQCLLRDGGEETLSQLWSLSLPHSLSESYAFCQLLHNPRSLLKHPQENENRNIFKAK